MPPIALTMENLEGFERWLLRRNRDPETARCYLSHLKMTIRAEHVTTRLMDKKLSAKTRHSNLAAIMAWAKYAKDPELVEIVEEIRLPPNIRAKPKKELVKADWAAILEVLNSEQIQQPWGGKHRSKHTRGLIKKAPRLLLLIVATRGLRVGDALRLTRAECRSAVETGKLSFEAKGGRRLEYDAKTIKPYLEELLEMPDWQVTRDLVAKKTSSTRAVNTTMRRSLRRCAIRANIQDVHPHRLRRTYATHFVRRLDRDPLAMIKLMKHMGWTNINTAAQYVDNVDLDELDKMGADLLADVTAARPAKKSRK